MSSMKRLILFLILGFAVAGCWNDQSRNVLNSFADEGDHADTPSFPLVIDGSTKIVYQRGHMTRDKGLKLYYDTIPYPSGGLHLPDSVLQKLSSK